jgi:hypothetical protein
LSDFAVPLDSSGTSNVPNQQQLEIPAQVPSNDEETLFLRLQIRMPKWRHDVLPKTHIKIKKRKKQGKVRTVDAKT